MVVTAVQKNKVRPGGSRVVLVECNLRENGKDCLSDKVLSESSSKRNEGPPRGK